MTTLVTGAAGFIGFHTAKALLARGQPVVGLDNLNDYYDVGLKMARLDQLRAKEGFSFVKADLADAEAVLRAVTAHGVRTIIHLGAQAGVRHSIENPAVYAQGNLVGFVNILEAARSAKVRHLTYASTSSVYGANTRLPSSEADDADHPLQLYAATKRANELMAHSYSHLFGLPTTGLRFFTVYGPWGRPDMALFIFAKAMLAGEPITLFNNGAHTRDFTYVDDIVEGIVRVSDRPAAPSETFDPQNPARDVSNAPFRVYNIGNGAPVDLMDYVRALEDTLQIEAKVTRLPLQPGDAVATHADTTRLEAATGFRPHTDIADGVARFVDWYRGYYG